MESQPKPRRLLQRPLPVSILALVAIAALAAGFLWTNRLALAEYAAIAVLRELGVAPAALTIDKLTLDGATVSGIALGPDRVQRVARIDATYSLAGLQQGRVDRLRISDLRLRARWRDGGLELPGLTALSAGSDDGAFAVEAVVVDGFHMALETADGTVILEGERAEADLAKGDITADVTVRSLGAPVVGRITGRLEATLFSGGEILGRFAVHDGSIAAPNGRADTLRGAVQIILGAAGPELDARLDIARLVLGKREIRDARITLAAAGSLDDIAVDGQLDALAGRARLRGNLRRSADGGARFKGTGTASLAIDDLEIDLRGGLDLARTRRGDLSGELAIETARLRMPEMSLDGVTGSAAFTLAGDPIVDAALRFQRLRAPGVAGLPGTLTLRLDGQELTASGEVTAPDGRLALDVRGDPGEALDYKAVGTIALGTILTAFDSPIQGRGSVAFELAGRVTKPLDLPADPADAVTVTGWVDAALDGIAVPATLGGGAVRGRIGVALRPGDWRVDSEALRLSAATLDADILARLPSPVRDRLKDGVRLAVNGPSALRITPLGDRYAAAFDGAIRLAAKDLTLDLQGDAEGEFGREVALRTAAGRYNLDASHRGPVADFLAPLTVQAKVTGGFKLGQDILALDADPASLVTIAAIVAPGLARTGAPVTLSPAKLLRAVFDMTDTPRLRTIEGAIAAAKNRLILTTGSDTIDVEMAPMTLRISGTKDGFQFAVADGAFALPAYGIDATGIAATLRLNDAAAVTLAIGDIRQRGADAIVVPLRLEAAATQRGGQVEFSGRLFDAPERLSIRATGRHDIAKNSGAVSIDGDPLTFLPTVLQPRQLFPVLRDSLREVDGRIGGQARLQWRAGNLRSSAEVFAELNTLKVEGATVADAAATIVFDSLFPLSTPPRQEISIGLLDVGVPLSKGRIEFQIGPDGAISAALRELDFFGGRIESKTIAIPADLDGFTIPLMVTGVQLESLFALTEIGDLEATGTLNGNLPLVIENGAVELRQGVLESAPGGGTIRYRPQAVGPALAEANEGTALFLKVVRDFSYDKVRVTLDEDPSGGVASRFEITGRNATVYNGIPVQLNITMSGPLREILNQNVKTYTLPGRLLTRIRAPGKKATLPSGN